MRKDEIFAKYPQIVAEALIAHCGTTPGANMAHPQAPDCADAHLFEILTELKANEQETQTHMRLLKLAGELGHDVQTE